MMSEKQFVLCKRGDVEYIEENCCVQLYGFDVICEKLSEQQATINRLKEQNKQLQEKLKDTTDEVKDWKDIVERYRSSAKLDLEECTILQGNKKYVGKVRKFVKYENHSSIDLYDLKEIDGGEYE